MRAPPFRVMGSAKNDEEVKKPSSRPPELTVNFSLVRVKPVVVFRMPPELITVPSASVPEAVPRALALLMRRPPLTVVMPE